MWRGVANKPFICDIVSQIRNYDTGVANTITHKITAGGFVFISVTRYVGESALSTGRLLVLGTGSRVLCDAWHVSATSHGLGVTLGMTLFYVVQ